MLRYNWYKSLIEIFIKNIDLSNSEPEYQIKLSISLAVLRQRVQLIGRAHHRVIAPGQYSSFRNVVEVASRWQHCVRFDRPKI